LSESPDDVDEDTLDLNCSSNSVVEVGSLWHGIEEKYKPPGVTPSVRCPDGGCSIIHGIIVDVVWVDGVSHSDGEVGEVDLKRFEFGFC